MHTEKGREKGRTISLTSLSLSSCFVCFFCVSLPLSFSLFHAHTLFLHTPSLTPFSMEAMRRKQVRAWGEGLCGITDGSRDVLAYRLFATLIWLRVQFFLLKSALRASYCIGLLSSPAWDCFSECFSETLAAAADLSASDSCLLLKRMQFCAAAVFGRMYQSSEGTDASVSLDPLVEGNQVLN